MPARSITDGEIALIKAMLARGMKNKDIQFFFNRPDRPVNSGRITGIANGSYGGAASIAAATDAELDAYIAGHASPALTGVSVPVAVRREPLPPTHPEVVAALFAKDAGGIWRLTVGETDQHECKTNFGFRHSGAWLKAIAALSNNRGGYVLFGVQDKNETDPARSYAVTGLKSDEFANADPAEFTKRIKSVLDPTPRVQVVTTDVGGVAVGVIYVEPHPSRPVIVTRPEGDQLKEGDIFYRYPGQSNRIKYSDLRALLDERDAQARRDVLPLVERLLALGPQRALVADLEAGVLDDGKRSIMIDQQLIDQINFIREGEFDEKIGAPTLKLIGEVSKAPEAAAGTAGRGAIADENVLSNFLEQVTVVSAAEYIRFAVTTSSRDWLPIFFFARQAELDRAGLVNMIESVVTSKTKRRSTLIARASGSRPALASHSGTPARLRKALLGGLELKVENAQDAANIALALQGLPADYAGKLPPLLKLLTECRDQLLAAKRFEALSHVYRAAARIDELYFPV